MYSTCVNKNLNAYAQKQRVYLPQQGAIQIQASKLHCMKRDNCKVRSYDHRLYCACVSRKHTGSIGIKGSSVPPSGTRISSGTAFSDAKS